MQFLPLFAKTLCLKVMKTGSWMVPSSPYQWRHYRVWQKYQTHRGTTIFCSLLGKGKPLQLYPEELKFKVKQHLFCINCDRPTKWSLKIQGVPGNAPLPTHPHQFFIKDLKHSLKTLHSGLQFITFWLLCFRSFSLVLMWNFQTENIYKQSRPCKQYPMYEHFRDNVHPRQHLDGQETLHQ